MFCSKCGAEAFGPFCASCGAEIIPPKSASEPKVQEPAPTNMPKANIKPTILLKSTNCDASLRETEKKTQKLIRRFDISIGGTLLFLVFLPEIIAVLNDEKIKYAKQWPWPVLLIMFVCAIVAVYAIHKRRSITADIFDKYIRYCSKETLIIDDQKIYGSTNEESVELPYDQIRSVSFTTHVESSNSFLSDPCCDILTIRDTNGKQYVFYSFANCREIKSVIDMQLKECPSYVGNTASGQKAKPSAVNTKEYDGSTIPEIAADGEIICPACGSKQKSDRKVCWNCGIHFYSEVDGAKSRKCQLCNCESEQLVYCVIKDDFGTRYRDICPACIEKYNAKRA